MLSATGASGESAPASHGNVVLKCMWFSLHTHRAQRSTGRCDTCTEDAGAEAAAHPTLESMIHCTGLKLQAATGHLRGRVTERTVSQRC